MAPVALRDAAPADFARIVALNEAGVEHTRPWVSRARAPDANGHFSCRARFGFRETGQQRVARGSKLESLQLADVA